MHRWKATVCTLRKKKVSQVLSQLYTPLVHFWGLVRWCRLHICTLPHNTALFLSAWTSKARIVNAVLACTTILSLEPVAVATSLSFYIPVMKTKHRTILASTISRFRLRTPNEVRCTPYLPVMFLVSPLYLVCLWYFAPVYVCVSMHEQSTNHISLIKQA